MKNGKSQARLGMGTIEPSSVSCDGKCVFYLLPHGLGSCIMLSRKQSDSTSRGMKIQAEGFRTSIQKQCIAHHLPLFFMVQAKSPVNDNCKDNRNISSTTTLKKEGPGYLQDFL